MATMVGDDASKILHLSGFSELETTEKAAVNKVFDHHLRRLTEITKKLQTLEVHLKKVHSREKSEKYEIKAMLIDSGKKFAASTVDRDLIAALHDVLGKLEREIAK
jgi:ribosome-associated translation inhibitor RaiA